MKVFTIGFAKKSAREFFHLLRTNGVKRVIDVRLNNKSQLAGYTKEEDLRYFLHEILGIEYCHVPQLAPTKELLDGYRDKKIDWIEYERAYGAILQERNVDKMVDPAIYDQACLLCSEPTADRCHRRLLAEAIEKAFPGTVITHL